METTNYYKASISILIQKVACHLVLDYNQIDDDSIKKEMIHTMIAESSIQNELWSK